MNGIVPFSIVRCYSSTLTNISFQGQPKYRVKVQHNQLACKAAFKLYPVCEIAPFHIVSNIIRNSLNHVPLKVTIDIV